MAATGWLSHTVRGTFAGAFNKKPGLALVSDKGEGDRVYCIAGLLQGVDESQCCRLGVLVQTMLYGLLDVPVGQHTRDDGLGLHPRVLGFVPDRTRSRSDSK